MPILFNRQIAAARPKMYHPFLHDRGAGSEDLRDGQSATATASSPSGKNSKKRSTGAVFRA
jgi:hypothetical protein